MAYTARELITDAIYTSGKVSEGYQSISGMDIARGLKLLNELLAVKAVYVEHIPYFTEYDSVFTLNTEKIYIPNLVEIDTFTYELSTDVRMPIIRKSRGEYFATARANNVNALPTIYREERALGGMNVYVYFIPDKAYPFKIIGKFSLSNVDLDTDLSLTYDLFYISYLRYTLAEYICNFENFPVLPQIYEKIKEFESTFIDISPKDCSMSNINLFQRGGGAFGWGDVFIGRGWRGR